MGQILQQDKIGSLSESGGTITLGPSTLTIGGRQYKTDALNVASDITLANQRYQIYAVRSAGNTIIIIDSSENSVGPSGQTSWKLIGSYQTNDSETISFGSFINIKGTPTTDLMTFDFRPVGGWAALVRTDRTGMFQRIGNTLKVTRFSVGPTGGGGAAVRTDFINGLTAVNTPLNPNVIGEVSGSTGRRFVIIVLLATPQRFGFQEVTANYLTEIADSSYGVGGQNYQCNYEVIVNEWSNTPIEDL